MKLPLLIATGLGLGIGLGAGTAAVASRATHAVPADSVGVDSLAVADSVTAAADSVGAPIAEPKGDAGPAVTDTTGRPRAITDSATGTVRPNVAAGAAAVAGIAAAGKTEPTHVDSARARLSRIFGAMEPEQAANVLTQLADGQVEAVLFGLSERKAAAILASFPPDRAALLASAMMTKER